MRYNNCSITWLKINCSVLIEMYIFSMTSYTLQNRSKMAVYDKAGQHLALKYNELSQDNAFPEVIL